MNLVQAFKMAFKSIAMKKTRSFLTMLGIIIGVASVVIMVSVMQGKAKKSMEMFDKLGDNKITVQAFNYYDMDNETGQLLFDYCLSLGDLVVGITPEVEVNETATIQYGSKTVKTNLPINASNEYSAGAGGAYTILAPGNHGPYSRPGFTHLAGLSSPPWSYGLSTFP